MASYEKLKDEPKASFETCDESEKGSTEQLLESGTSDRWQDYETPRRSSRVSVVSWTLQLIVFAASLVFFWTGIGKREMTDRECAAQTGAYSTAWDAVEYTRYRFQGAILDENPWNGHPTPNNDKAWKAIANQDVFAISEEDMKELKKPLTQIKFPESAGGGYMASLEVFHQLHCLNSLRQYTYLDYYSQLDEKPFWFKFDNVTRRAHLGLVTYSWVKGHPAPYPDFSNWHKCRDNVPLIKYHRKNRVQIPDFQPGQEDTIIDKPPCEGAYNNVDDPDTVPEVCP